MDTGFFILMSAIGWAIMHTSFPKNFLFLGKHGAIVFCALPIGILMGGAIWLTDAVGILHEVIGWSLIGLSALGCICSFWWEPEVNYRKEFVDQFLSGYRSKE